MTPDNPEDWTMAKLSDFFTRKEMDYIVTVCNKSTFTQATTILRPWFIERRKKLEAKGLVPEYAAYAIPYFIKRQL